MDDNLLTNIKNLAIGQSYFSWIPNDNRDVFTKLSGEDFTKFLKEAKD